MGFNKAQNEAIMHGKGPCQVLAGPGSGKTLTIVNRIKYLIERYEVRPEEILVVTFTRFAAAEMKSRLCSLMGKSNVPVTAGTFHGIYYGILKWAYRLGPDNILSEEEKYAILKEMTLEFGQELAQEGDFQEDVAKEISVVKGGRISLDHYYSSCCPDEVFRQIYSGYCQTCQARRKLDFDDMLLYCYELFVQRKDILAAWQNKFQYILVDEFQDINQLQYDIVRMLAKPQDNLFIVGDDDQSIYHFRGARPEIMLNFTKDYPKAETVTLDVNYRCSGRILSSALRLIGSNKKRFQKNLSTPNQEGSAVTISEYQNPREEYLSVVARLRERLEKGDDLKDTALLLRTNQEAEGLVGALMERQVPFYMKEKLPNLFHHWICRNLLAYMRFANGDRSRKNFLEFMNRPNRYIARDALSLSPEISFDQLKEHYKDKDWMCDRLTTLETHLRILKGLAPYAAINFIRKGMGYEEYLREYAEYRKIKPEELSEILDRLTESTKGMDSLKEWEDYIEDYTQKLEEQARKQEKEREGVLISTLHGVKGLEYDRVYILNVNEGSMPYKKAVLEAAIEEERRLFYVGMTRARKELTLCYVRQQYEKKREPSRFLKEAGV